MRQAQNWLVIGASGGGKTHFVNDLLEGYKARARYLVIVNTSKQLSEHCNHCEDITEEKLELPYEPTKLAELIRVHGSVHFEVSSNSKNKAFMERLSQAIWLLGKMDTEHCEVLYVIDEARYFVGKQSMCKGHERLESEGRKFGFDIIKLTQRITSSDWDALNHAAINQVTRFCIFPLSEQNQRDRIMAMMPDAPDPATLQRPEPSQKLPGEYIVWDYLKSEGAHVVRAPDGSRHAVPIRPGGMKGASA
jgi:GTPase SAR1 family protein